MTTTARRRGKFRAVLTLTGVFLAGGLATTGWAGPLLPMLSAIRPFGIERPPMPADARRERLGSPPAAPDGVGGYAFTALQPRDVTSPVTYDPCRPIHVVVNSHGAPRQAGRLLNGALAEISRTTGLQFTVEGQTDEQPRSGRPPMDRLRYGDRWSPVLVAWTTPSVIAGLDGDVAGLGGSVSFPGVDGRSPRWVSGVVYLDAPAIVEMLRQGKQGLDESSAILKHELGHLVGLGHVTDQGELMAPSYHGGPAQFGPGDLRGLQLLGLGPCHFDA
jgi:Matrixin